MREQKTVENDTKIVTYQSRKKISPMRKAYILKFIGRCLVLGFCILLGILKPQEFAVLQDFTGRFSVLHLLWFVWMADMFLQIFYVKNHVPLGSQKLFQQRYIPVKNEFDGHALREYISRRTKSAYQVFVIYAVGITVLGLLKKTGILNDVWMLVICVFFYVCDLICVLIWCPFRLMMKNRCCTTCRIFNWDHIMMFTPMLFVKGFFSISLLVMAFAILIIWELCVALHPERFWEKSNAALKCSECTDKLCTQYCQKLR